MRIKGIAQRCHAAISTLVVVVLAVLLVLGIAAIPGKYTRFDMSREGYYTLSDESRSVLSELDETVELILLAAEGGEDLTVKYLLQRYADESGLISVRSIDPSSDKEIAAEYAQSLRYTNSIAVVSGERKCLVDFTELYESDYSDYMKSGDTADIKSVFRAESAITGAIRYVTADDLPCLYLLTGHEEAAIGETIRRGLRGEGILTAELDLSAQDVPTDADAVLIHAPSFDLSAEEREKLTGYLEDGGKLILISAYSGEPMPELLSLMQPYGCTLSDGLVVEQDREHYAYGYYDCLIPILAEHELTEGVAANSVVMPGSQAILHKETADVSMTPLLTTTAAAYASTDLGSVGKKEGDISGPLTVAALLEKGDGRVIWFASGFMLDENYGGANSDLFLSGVRFLCGSVDTDIPARDISAADTSLRMTGPQVMLIGALFTLVVPLSIVIAGAVILLRRRRRA